MLAALADRHHGEGVRPHDGDLLEIERRPFEALRRLDAGDGDAPARAGDADADLEGLGRADGVVDDVDAAVEHGQAAPRVPALRARGIGDGVDESAGRPVGPDALGAETPYPAGSTRLESSFQTKTSMSCMSFARSSPSAAFGATSSRPSTSRKLPTRWWASSFGMAFSETPRYAGGTAAFHTRTAATNPL